MRQKKFDALDGLRGIAAIAVFAFHMLELIFHKPAENPLRHAALAVDFFFCLSGYVIGHAYDARRAADVPEGDRLTLWDFALRRLIRLHPLVICGLIGGLIAFLCDPFVGSHHSLSNVGFKLMTENVILGLLLIPAPALMWHFTHSLNAPAWSLTQEYLANAIYGLFGHRVGKRALWVVLIISAAGLLVIAWRNDTLCLGADWRTIWVAPVRVATSFTLGLLLCRLSLRWRLRHAFPVLSLILIAIMASPTVPGWNGPIEWLIVIVAFPCIVIAGAGYTSVAGNWGTLCRLSGRLSYPLYMMHYSFVLYFVHWLRTRKPAPTMMWLVFAGTLIVVTIFSWVVMRFIDEPIRAYLSRVMATRNCSHPPTDAGRPNQLLGI
jgi:peptidoglycan/LPS O-acetylase OafA/YrhL